MDADTKILEPKSETDFSRWVKRQAASGDNGGFSGVGELLKAVGRASEGKGFDERLTKTMTEGVDAAGGFTVPPEQVGTIWAGALEESVALSRCTVIPMKTDHLMYPKIDDSSHASSLFGGVVGYWVSEAGTKQESQPAFAKMNLIPKKLVILARISQELLDDSPACEAAVRTVCAKAVAYFVDEALILGTGAGQPLGILNSGCLITCTKKAGQAATTFVYENAADMFGRMHGPGKSSGVWLVNNDVAGQLLRMALIVGTGGGPTWVANVAGSPPQGLLGRPLIYTEKCQTLGTAGDVLFCDWSQYLVAMRSALTVRVSRDFYFTTNEILFAFECRLDGQPFWTSDLTPRHSAVTLSPFICVESRT